MSEKNFKPLTAADFNLTPEELKELVEGAARVFPPEPDEKVDEPGN